MNTFFVSEAAIRRARQAMVNYTIHERPQSLYGVIKIGLF